MGKAVRKDETGNRYGHLTVVRYSHTKNQALWLCQCSCGAFTTVQGDHLRRGVVISCGAPEHHLKHGHSRRGVRHPDYYIWTSMNNRCRNPNANGYAHYGGRGITVCDRWVHSFEAFIADMGPRPSRQHSIGRIDNDKGYAPGNCQWETPRQQLANTRRNTYLTIKSERRHVADWCRYFGILPSTYHNRRRRGWSPERALGIGT